MISSPVRIILAAVGAITAVIVFVRFMRRRAIKRLVKARFNAGLCIMCGADLRFGKKQCPKCGYKYDWVLAWVWDSILERRKTQESYKTTEDATKKELL